jgi:hypothetical protein
MVSVALGANIYGNNATGGAPYAYKMDSTTFAVLDTYTNLSGINGRGVVVVGDTMYYTTAGSGDIYSYTLSTHTNNGLLFNTGQGGIATIAYTGTSFWINSYDNTDPNEAYEYSLTGTLLKTITLSSCGNHCDGLEYFVSGGQGRLISNRGDAQNPGHYDIYDTDGNLLTANFIQTTFSATGIAFDGTDFLVSDIFSNRIAKYDGTTGAFISSNLITDFGGFDPLIEDLSADYEVTLPPSVPEPTSLLLLGSGLLLSLVVRHRRS